MVNYLTAVDILLHRAAIAPEQTAYTFLADGVNESGKVTYRELDTQARAIAAKLQSTLKSGDRALLIYPYDKGLEFIAAFMGCLYAGVIAVTDYPPQQTKSISKFQNRLVDSQAKVILTNHSLLERIKGNIASYVKLSPKLAELPWIASDRVELNLASNWQQPKLNSDTLAFFQYTSGSTGNPKGVMVTHGNILHNSEVIKQAFQHHQQTKILMWLPMFHDMGLVGGVMQPLYGGYPAVLMSPLALIQQPVLWLQAMSRYQITTSGGPNFAYDLLCQKVTPQQRETLDLSHWEVAFSGAETVRAETLAKFAELYAPCGFKPEAFYPCYGMAEATLFITGVDKTKYPQVLYLSEPDLAENKVVCVEPDTERAKAVVSCGCPWLGDEIIIVDPETLTRCPSNRVGEIWVNGRGVAKGYWQQPEATERDFNAHLANNKETTYLRTGDLGFIRDGELYIVGRIKDVMIIWGTYRYPQHIEQTVQDAHPALRTNAGAAFAVEIAGEERLVIASEVERTFLRRLPVEEIITAIRQAVGIEHTVDVYTILLLKTGSIPKTTSGKIQRRACRQGFLDGTLNLVGKWQQKDLSQSNITDLMQRMAE
ncbi:fatty acyl-AMP ligase [Myxosarcina sp. GI1]|uniref:fatty acyl-AMP ligase n=1 Tax=Myxosarcina sp. GI1 TaxID=1541065 RepID=UPI00055A5D08|nr:fatty acyl-AMP ligase [Myxosarcina sp. GI1]